MSERTELVMLAELLYNAFKDRPSLAWMGPFEQMSLVRKENWLRVAWAVKTNRWITFETGDLDEIMDHLPDNDLSQEIYSELARRAEREKV